MTKASRSSRRRAAREKIARSVVDVILGEAAFNVTPEERLRDMQAIASVIMNRAQRLGVTPEDVVSGRFYDEQDVLQKQFDAYDKALPEGSEQFRKLAELALRDVKAAGPVNNATYYATPDAVHWLPDRLQFTGQTAGHMYFDDPELRNIVTGFKEWKELQPAPDFLPRTQTPMYDAGQIGRLRPGVGHAVMAQPSLVGKAATDRFVRGRTFWSNPAWQSYLFDFAAPAVAPPDVAPPEHVPIPQPRPQFERRSLLEQEPSQFEVLAFGTNDFAQPRKAVSAFEQAVANARANNRTPVAVMPNAANPKIGPVARAIRTAAERLDVRTITPKSWARDGIHPSASEYRAIGEQFDGAVVRGDSFADGIIGAQGNRNPLSWGKVGASSAAVISAIADIDRGASAGPAGLRGALGGLGASIDFGADGLADRALAPSGADTGALPDTAPVPQARPDGGMGELIERYGPKRPNRPNEAIISMASRAVKDVLGPDWSAVGTSGMENPGYDYSGAGRHPTGDALDFYAQNTRTGEVATHEQMARVAHQAAYLGATGVGFGRGYMRLDGIAKAHIDTARPNAPKSWGARNTRHTMDPGERARIMGGMLLGVPAVDPFGGGLPTPRPRPGTERLGPLSRPGNMPDNVGTSIPDSLKVRGIGAAPMSDFRAPPSAGPLGRPESMPDNVGRSIPASLRVGGLGAAPMSDFRAPPSTRVPAPSAEPMGQIQRNAAADDPFAGIPPSEMPNGFIGASSASPFSPSVAGALELASLERTPGLPGFRPATQPQPGFVPQATALPDMALRPDLLGPEQTFRQQPPQQAGFVPQGAVLPDMALYQGLLGPEQTFTQQPQQAIQVPNAAPSLSPPREIFDTPTIAPVREQAPRPSAVFPAAPPPPDDDSIFGPRLKGGLLGALVGGVPGAIAGALLAGGLPGVGGLLGRLDNGPMGPAGPAERFNAGYGIGGIEQGMYGPRGATGFSLSNPGAFAVSRGPGQGWDLTNQLGARTTYGPGGDVRANSDTVRAWGGLLGSLFGGGTGGLLGEREKGEKKDKDKRERTDLGPAGLY